ncbi:MAG: hypothetical protein IAG10_32750 [Planctomycetaceae bacterium]|nr:hypothetical protein [Planctomycetaceae bacterium]
MSAAETYLSKGNHAQAKEVLDFVVGKNYANAKTQERIAQIQKTLTATAAVPTAPPADA